jgi:hypothetical protein
VAGWNVCGWLGQADVAILEEPEHLTWFHHGRRWTSVFDHVVGIMHTNYVDYVRRISPVAARAVAIATRRMCSIHCHKVALQFPPFPYSTLSLIEGGR